MSYNTHHSLPAERPLASQVLLHSIRSRTSDTENISSKRTEQFKFIPKYREKKNSYVIKYKVSQSCHKIDLHL